jgi:hypothetical protein
LLDISLDENGYASELLEVQDASGITGYLIYKNTSDLYEYIYIKSEPSIWIPAEDSEGRVLSDKYFVNSSVQYNEAFQAMIELTFNSDGSEIF